MKKTYHHIPADDLFRTGVCFEKRLDGTVIDTIVIHSCYVDMKKVGAGKTSGKQDNQEQFARNKFNQWKESLKTKKDTPGQIAKTEDLEKHALGAALLWKLPIEQIFEYSIEAIINIFRFYGVSAHYIIDRQGNIYELVPPHLKAFHAGESATPEKNHPRTGLNNFSIGIELLGNTTARFTAEQYQSAATLVTELEKQFPLRYCYGHSEVAPTRTLDPYNFDWNEFLHRLIALGSKIRR